MNWKIGVKIRRAVSLMGFRRFICKVRIIATKPCSVAMPLPPVVPQLPLIVLAIVQRRLRIERCALAVFMPPLVAPCNTVTPLSSAVLAVVQLVAPLFVPPLVILPPTSADQEICGRSV